MIHLSVQVDGKSIFNGNVDELHMSHGRTASSVDATFPEGANEGVGGKAGDFLEYVSEIADTAMDALIESFEEGKVWKWLKKR